MTLLADLFLDELNAWLEDYPVPGYAGSQIFRWLGRGVASFDDMTDLSLNIRRILKENALTGIPIIVSEQRSFKDGTVKYAFKTHDGNIIESVLMKYRHGYSVCVSSQAGCRMGCTFCASLPSRFSRSLSPGEMFGQVAAISRHERPRSPDMRVGNVVIMGIGEPFDNYENTMKFIRMLHEHDETNIGYRRITVSTCGIVPGILRLADEGLPVGLSVSLHAHSDSARRRVMPVANKYSIDKLIEACKIYTEKTKRRVTFEYALIRDINDSSEDASSLAQLVRSIMCHVNLIPINKTDHTDYFPSPNVSRFAEILTMSGINTTVRRGLGTDIKAACGQLRNKIEVDNEC